MIGNVEPKYYDQILRIMNNGEKAGVYVIYGWNLTVCGDRRKHEFSGNCQVPDNWNDFSRLMDALKAKTNEPSLDLSLYLASENY